MLPHDKYRTNHFPGFTHLKVKVAQSCPTLCDPMECTVPGILPGQNTGVGSLSLLQGIFQTQGFNPGLLHCRRILYQLSHKGSPITFQALLIYSSQNTLRCLLLFSFYRWGNWDHRVEANSILNSTSVQFSSVAQSWPILCDPHESQHARPPCPSPTPRVHSNSRPSYWWYHPAISSSVVPFSSCPQSLPASESFPMSQLFASGGQSIGISASTSVLPMNTQDWSPLGWTGWISL